MYKSILIATDGSKLAEKALEHGLALAKNVGAKILIVTVTEMWSPLEVARETRVSSGNAIEIYENAATEHASRILDKAAKRASEIGVEYSVSHIRDQVPSEGILQAAKENGCDLIVMASHGRRGIDRVLLGSQTHEVVTHTKIPVLVLR